MVRISLDNDSSSFPVGTDEDNAEWNVLQTLKRSDQTIGDEGDEDEEEEPPHPLGFSSSLGRTRFSVDAEQDENESSIIVNYKRQWGYLNPSSSSSSTNYNHGNSILTSPMLQQQQQQYPPLNSYLDAETAPTSALLRYDYQQKRRQKSEAASSAATEDPMEKIIMLLQASSIVDEAKLEALLSPVRQVEAIKQQMMSLPKHVQQQRDYKIQQRVERYRTKFAQEQEEAAHSLASLLQRQEKAQARAQHEQQKRLEEEQHRQEDERQRKQQKEDEEEEAERMQNEKRQASVQAQQHEDARVAKENAVEQEARKQVEALQNQQQQPPEYIGRAKQLVADLVQLRASVEPFETSKVVSKRRLGIKKIANGKVNTLTEDPAKVQSVAMEVSQAISAARGEDAEAKQRLDAQDPSVSVEMTRGKRYFLDFLCSKAIVRAQADGFNGQRGDGFPLANMLTLVSVENRDINPILAAHIYTVCPVAIPALPTPSKDASEDEFMESLGMLKEKNGEFETFEKFLSRTEGLISLMVDIMSAQPRTHTLMGGNEGAVKWLSRFLKLLPEAPVSPLPLLTAPVLDAFLTGAGHMLANIHSEHFRQYLDVITNDIMNRLDVGPIGKPSSIRLKKTIEGGFSKFKSELPSRAMTELYLSSSGSGSSQASHSPPRVSVSQRLMGYSPPQRTMSSASPFGQASGQSSQSSNPFGVPSNTNDRNRGSFSAFGNTSSNQSPFGASSNAGAALSPFGGQASVNRNSDHNQSIFGAVSNSNQSPFGNATNTNSNQSPFGTSGAQNQNSIPFGGSTGNNQSLFSTGPSPFGSNQEIGMEDDSGVHGSQPGNVFGSPAPAATPFGPSSSPFGSSPNATPFGGAPSSAFGSSTNATPFGQPSISASPFGSTFSGGSPFGGNPAAGPMSTTPFGQSSSFVAPTSAPFGLSGQSGGMFGAGHTSPSPFGSSAPSNSSPFGAPSQPGTSLNKPTHRKDTGGSRTLCKFFAQGRCRFGDNCRFSHDTGGGGGGFGSNNNTFGGSQQNSFRGNNNSFGSNTPFGGPRR